MSKKRKGDGRTVAEYLEMTRPKRFMASKPGPKLPWLERIKAAAKRRIKSNRLHRSMANDSKRTNRR